MPFFGLATKQQYPDVNSSIPQTPNTATFEILVLVTGSVSPPLIMPAGNKASRNQLAALIHKHTTQFRKVLFTCQELEGRFQIE